MCLQQNVTASKNISPRLIKSLYVDYTLTSNNKWLSEFTQKLTLLKFHAVIKTSQSKEIVLLLNKMNTIKELYVSQLNDETFDLIVKHFQNLNVVYALISLSNFRAENVLDTKLMKSLLQKCCTFQSVHNLIINNCSFCSEDLIASVSSKNQWKIVSLTECCILGDSDFSNTREYFSSQYVKVDKFKLN